MADCCPECAELTERWHRYAVDYARRGNRRGCFATAGFDNRSWASAISHQLAKNNNLQASIDHHSGLLNRAEDDDEEAHRRRVRRRARAKLSDYVWTGNPDPDGLRKLIVILEDGVEDRESPGGQEWSPCEGVHRTCGKGRRPPTRAEIGKRILQAGDPEFVNMNELSEDQLLGLDSFKRDARGSTTITTTARWATPERSKLEGLYAAQEINVEVDRGRTLLLAAVEAEQEALLALWRDEDVGAPELREATGKLADGVLRRLGGVG